jgi:hypothetical protein
MQYNVFGSKHRSNVQGNEENSNRKPVFNKSVSIKRLSENNSNNVKIITLKGDNLNNVKIITTKERQFKQCKKS